jgi:hypothetical protein
VQGSLLEGCREGTSCWDVERGLQDVGKDGQLSREREESLSAGGTAARTTRRLLEQDDMLQMHVVVALAGLYGSSDDVQRSSGDSGQAQAGQGLAGRLAIRWATVLQAEV